MSKTTSTTVICTILNEAETITELLTALELQSLQPNEVIIVDGGSSDGTQKIIFDFLKNHKKLNLRVLEKKGNRSIGRNFAIEQAKTDLIACTDAGCIPKKNWLEELLKVYKETKSPVISGYYEGKSGSGFENAVIPYALVMPDSIDQNNFLPATRSMLFEKSVWSSVGKFNEQYSDNEDYVFAQKLKKNNVQISFARNAVVIWKPRKTFIEFFWMIFRFARGDMFAQIIRPKVVLIFARYLIGIFCVIYLCRISTQIALSFFSMSFILYSSWAILKNLKYVKNGWIWLPILQISSDIAVIFGSIAGAIKLSTSRSN